MDPAALIEANARAGNQPGLAAIEWGMGAGMLRIAGDVPVAMAGADAAVRREGDVLAVDELRAGAWLYLAVRGGIDVAPVLGSRSTYLPGGFGGFEGRLLRTGDVLPIGEVGGRGREGEGTGLPVVPDARLAVAIVPGPDRYLLRDDAWADFLAAEWVVSRAVSRAGYRLDGPALTCEIPDDLPSAPVCPGTIQLPPGGRPIVLMPDGPTVGGYPRIAVVLSESLGRLAQRRPGEPARFRLR